MSYALRSGRSLARTPPPIPSSLAGRAPLPEPRDIFEFDGDESQGPIPEPDGPPPYGFKTEDGATNRHPNPRPNIDSDAESEREWEQTSAKPTHTCCSARFGTINKYFVRSKFKATSHPRETRINDSRDVKPNSAIRR